MGGHRALRVPILLEAVIGLVTAFDIKADVLVSIALDITGVLNPVMGGLVHNVGSVLAILNSALLLKWRGRTPRRKTI